MAPPGHTTGDRHSALDRGDDSPDSWATSVLLVLETTAVRKLPQGSQEGPAYFT